MNDRMLVKPSGTAKSIVPASLVIKGGVVEGQGGLLIDGKLTDTRIVSMDGSVIQISAQAVLVGCSIEGVDLLIEGDFDGSARITGNCEISASAKAVGKLEVAGDLFKSRYADAVDLKVVQFHTETQDASMETPRLAAVG